MRKHYIILALLTGLLILAGRSGCCEAAETTATPAVIDNSNDPVKKKVDKAYCLETFWDIIETQNLLRAYDLGYEEMAHRHRAGQITDEKMEIYRTTYRTTRTTLLQKLEDLYVQSRKAGCAKEE
jgi:hypothetical protein